MRSIAWRFQLLTGLLAVAFAAPAPAYAADDGGVDVHDHVVHVHAHALIPGLEVHNSGEPDGCTWHLVIDNDRVPVYDVDGRPLYSDTGRWFQRICGGQPVDVNGFFVVPEGGGFSIPDVAVQARDQLDPPRPSWSASPNGTSVAMVAQMPTWLWVKPVYWNDAYIVRVETPSGRIWAEARATPSDTSWDTGDGQLTVCANGGTVWHPHATPTTADCVHTFRHSTAGTAGRAMTVTVNFAVTGRTSTNTTSAPVGAISRTSAPQLVQVGEIQAIGSNGP